ncbi:MULTISPECIES: DUF1573 domain-containing protein [unclassified Aureispira]|uniref:DUF1573 domain-containing protein n=1 Tax=unclassified Aureispira TaxID=2649989 RepID=UPI00069836B4|nr:MULTISPECIES: DUF1573 domain-containing protein [unclassified Aureispira]WMX16102.1 DUF1573 domain-containing protein [Aureispira sp. CCB-E]
MENKENLILGGMAVMALWLSVLTYSVYFSSSASASTLAATRALNTTATATPPTSQPAIKPTNTNTQPQQPEVDPATAANLVFSENEFDFGTLEEGEKVEHVFKFENTSNNPLTISNARGSCGCTVPEWPREPIAPGESGEIKVKFDSKGKKGKQSKTVTITANTIPANTILTITSDVIKLEGEDADASK